MSNSGKVKCTCGWSWNKSDSSKKDMYVCHECGRDNSNNMKNGGWLDNYNDSEVSLPEGFVGEGTFSGPKFDNPAWGGQFQTGGKLKFLQPNSDKLPEGYVIPYDTPSSELAMSIGGEDGEPAYLIPSFKYGKLLDDPIGEFRKTGEHLGGPFKTYQEADEWENETRHPAVERKETIMFPQEKFAMGGNLPGSVGFTYARTQNIPSEGKYAKKTLPSAQNGQEMQYYREGLDWQPKTISKNGGWLDDYDVAQDGKKVKFDAKKFAADKKRNTPLQQSIDKESISEDKRRWFDTKEYKDQVKANKLAEDKAIIQDRKNRIKNSISAREKSFTKDNWRQQLADETQAIGDKFRIFPEDPDSFIDEWMNPGVMIGNMASDLGSAPLRAQQEDSYMPYVTSIGVPLLTGGIEGIGAKTNKQFVSNLVNPLNIVPGYGKVKKALPGLVKKGLHETKKGLAKGVLATAEAAKDARQFGKNVARGIDDNVIYPIQYRKQIKDIKNIHNNVNAGFESPEGARRFQQSLGVDSSQLDYPSITTTPGIGSHYDSFMNNVNMDLRQVDNLKKEGYMFSPETVHSHEMGHWMGRESYRHSDDYRNAYDQYIKDLHDSSKMRFDIPKVKTMPTQIDNYAKQLYGYDPSTDMIDISSMPNNINDMAINNAKYFTHKGVEPVAHLREMRQNMLEKGVINNIYDPISNATIAKFIKENPTDRISSFTKNDYNKISGLGSIFRNLPSVVGAGALGATAIEQKKDGGIIKDDRGQWDHPGEITEIGSNEITMEGVPYDVLGVSDTGDVKLMKPGKNYKFKGKKVTEFPMAKNGINKQDQKTFEQLDQLTNFTNYNKPTVGGWLNKYN